MRSCILFLVLLAFAFSCKTPTQSPVLRQVKNVKLKGIDADKAYLHADLLFYNPNDVKITLRKVDIGVRLEEKNIGKVQYNLRTKIQPNSEFTVPVDATLNLDEFDFLNNLLALFGGKRYPIRYRGFIKVTVKGLPIKIPINHEDEVRLR